MQNPIPKLRQTSIISKKQDFCLKNWKLWRVPTTIEFNKFCWNFAHVRPRKKILLFPEMRVTRKIFTRAAAIFFKKFTLIKLFFVEKQLRSFLLLLVRINSLMENRFKDEIYRLNVYYYKSKTQSQTWT